MKNNAQPIVGFVFTIGGILTMYHMLKLTGKIPGPGWWPWNEIDSLVMKTLSLLKYVIPTFILIIVTLPILYFKKWWERKKELDRQEKLKESAEYERYLRNKREKEEIVLSRFKQIETELIRLSEEIIQMNKSPLDVNESALQAFL